MLILLLAGSAYATLLVLVELTRDGDVSIDGLHEAAAVAVSADGRYVYVAARTDDALVVFGRDGATGAPTFIARYRDGLDGVDGLDGAIDVAVSPDDKHIYVTGFNDDALAVFSQSVLTGKLSFIEIQKDGFASVEGLNGAMDVAVSPDNQHIYVTGFNDDALAVFGRDPETGRLSFVEVHRDGVAGVDGLDGAHSVAVSPDNQHIYVAGFNADALAVFSRDPGTGRLSFVEVHQDGVASVDGLDGARSVVVSPSGEHVFAVGQNEDALTVFGRDEATGELTFVTTYKEGLRSPRAVVASDSLYVAIEAIPQVAPPVAVFTQTVSGAFTLVEQSVSGSVDLGRLDALAISSDGLNLYGVSSSDHALATFNRNPTDGRLVFYGAHMDNTLVDGLDEANWITVSPDGKHVYVASGFSSQGDHAVAVFERNATTGKLVFVEVQKDGVNNVDGLRGAAAVAVSPDNTSVFVAGSLDDALAAFTRNEQSGRLTFVERYKDGSDGINGIQGASSVTVSPDGKHVYVTGYDDNALAVFERTTGTAGILSANLEFVEVHQDGIASADGLRGAIDVVVSPDNQHVYVAGFAEHGIGVYGRDSATGRLSFVEVQRDGVGAVDGLITPRSIVVSPDNQHVYVAAQTDNALVVFSRNSTTGRLSFVEVHRDGVGGVDGLDSARSVRIGSEGGTSYVYVASHDDRAISIFRRDPATGRLSFVGVIKQGVHGVYGLTGLSSLAISPNGRHIYTASFIDDAVALFTAPIRFYLPFIKRGQVP